MTKRTRANSATMVGRRLLRAVVALLVQGTTSEFAGTRSPLRLLEDFYISTAKEDFNGSSVAFDDAIAWHREHLHQRGSSGAHIACAEYGDGLHARSSLEKILAPAAVRSLANHKEHGTCFIATASPAQAAALSERPAAYGLSLFFPLPSVLKLAPGLLDHGSHDKTRTESARLQTTYGDRVQMTNNVHGLSLALSPGLLPAHDVSSSDQFISRLRESLMSGSVDLYAANFWSDPDMVDAHQARPGGLLRAREWTRAAHVVHQLSSTEGPGPGDVCSWSDLVVHHADDDHLMVTGLGHLLPGGRGAGGRDGEEAEELKTACFMGLVSYLVSTPEVLRLSPLHRPKILNAVAASVIQAGTIDTSQKPLTAAGLDGTGEVIQIIDTGLDETSCFFVDEDGEQVEHGYYFDEIGFLADSQIYISFGGGDFPVDISRRKIVQYVRLVRPDSASQDASFITSSGGGPHPWYSGSGFGGDVEEGHGTHTAGSAAGATLNDPAVTATCDNNTELGCVGGCFNDSYIVTLNANGYYPLDFDTWCPQHDCDGYGADFEICLDEDIAARLTANGGIAQGAKLSIFDASSDGYSIWPALAGNDLWKLTEETGCMLHSNSWGGDSYCTVTSDCAIYDQYMYENPEHLLLFAAGNDGEYKNDEDRDGVCTINFPGIAKNVLAVGASSSSIMRLTTSNINGNSIFDSTSSESTSTDFADIDTVVSFSSYGFTDDDRIKPEVVAPGDQVLSASSDGTDSHSCKVMGSSGTSMSTPIVAGAAAMIRQYFADDDFYATDVNAREFCDSLSTQTNAFLCDPFSPYAATVKAMLINSADLMGGSSEPDGLRGFGRVHLENTLPLEGSGDTALFVLDAADRSISENTISEFYFNLNSDSSLEFRATLAWIDPAASETSTIQLINDLDLTVVSPGGTQYRMWSSGADTRNVVERVIVSADDVDADNKGSWVIQVSSAGLTTASQSYSLVVTGPIGEGSGGEDSYANNAATHEVGLAGVSGALTTATMVVSIVVLAVRVPWL